MNTTSAIGLCCNYNHKHAHIALNHASAHHTYSSLSPTALQQRLSDIINSVFSSFESNLLSDMSNLLCHLRLIYVDCWGV